MQACLQVQSGIINASLNPELLQKCASTTLNVINIPNNMYAIYHSTSRNTTNHTTPSG